MPVKVQLHMESDVDGMADYWFTIQRGRAKELKVPISVDDVVRIIVQDLIETYASSGSTPDVSDAIECLVRKIYGEWGSAGTVDEIMAAMLNARGMYEAEEVGP